MRHSTGCDAATIGANTRSLHGVLIVAAVVSWVLPGCAASSAPAQSNSAKAAENDPLLKRVADISERLGEVFNSGADEITMEAEARRAVEGLNVTSLRAVHLGILLNNHAMIERSGIAEAARTRLQAFLDDDGADGATAVVHSYGERRRQAPDEDARVALYRATFNHPGLLEAAKLGAINDVLPRAAMTSANPQLRSRVIDDLLRLERLLIPETAVHLAHGYDWYFEGLQLAAQDGHEVELQRLRRLMVQLAEHAMSNLRSQHDRQYLTGVLHFLKGAAARGELLGHPAPKVEFLWSSDSALNALTDLQGRIVVLEFWATWCGPCVGALPKLQQLQQQYEGRPVVIVGATEVCGMFVTANGSVIKTEGEPEREFASMQQYIRDKEIGWPIVFCDQQVQPEFGVRGIPAVVIIDSKGIVRHTGLHPSQQEQVIAAIEELLRTTANPARASVRNTEG